jgi:hypothetical protein
VWSGNVSSANGSDSCIWNEWSASGNGCASDCLRRHHHRRRVLTLPHPSNSSSHRLRSPRLRPMHRATCTCCTKLRARCLLLHPLLRPRHRPLAGLRRWLEPHRRADTSMEPAAVWRAIRLLLRRAQEDTAVVAPMHCRHRRPLLRPTGRTRTAAAATAAMAASVLADMAPRLLCLRLHLRINKAPTAHLQDRSRAITRHHHTAVPVIIRLPRPRISARPRHLRRSNSRLLRRPGLPRPPSSILRVARARPARAPDRRGANGNANGNGNAARIITSASADTDADEANACVRASWQRRRSLGCCCS